MEDSDHRSWCVEANAVAQAALARRVVSENQRYALFSVSKTAQPAPALRQLADEGDAIRQPLIFHHIALGQHATLPEALEADRAADDAPVHLRQRHQHGHVARLQAVRIGTPAGLVTAGEHHLQHRDIAGQRVVARIIHRGLGERRGVEN